MDEQNIPIDINTSKLLDWLVSRRHIQQDWPTSILKIREMINQAIQDMPAHDGIIQLLSGQHINYFHCIKIIEILKETEADTKNLFGRYGSQRMKDWQDILTAYRKDNVYLAELAQLFVRNITYEIPSLRKQLAKLEQAQLDCEKKMKEYRKVELIAEKEFAVACEQLGIKDGDKIKAELVELLKELPEIYQFIAGKIKNVQPAIELYADFSKYLSGGKEVEVLEILRYLVKNGNTTTYEYQFGRKPSKIEIPEEQASSSSGDDIDYGEIDFGTNGSSGPEDSPEIIDWGAVATDDSFEIISHDDIHDPPAQPTITVKDDHNDGVAKGDLALTILDNPHTRDQIIFDLLELDSFLKMRLYEISSEDTSGDYLVSMSQMQDAPIALQMQTMESVTGLSDLVQVALSQLMDKRITHLHNIKHSAKYLDMLAGSLKQKLAVVHRMNENRGLLLRKVEGIEAESVKIQPIIKVLIERSSTLQEQIEQEISCKYKNRIVHIVGGVSSL